MQAFHPYSIFHLGDRALTIDFDEGIDAAVNRKVLSLFHLLQNAKLPQVLDLVPAYSSLTVYYDVMSVDKKEHTTAFDAMAELIRTTASDEEHIAMPERKVSIPVCYDERYAPDLEAVASFHDLTAREVIALHTARAYRVYMLGFLPGFAYMGEVDDRIATPRKASPRKKVMAGSVGIAGHQTGIYPLDAPGGWQLIGRTPLRLFDADQKDLALLQPGDAITFYAISEDEFAHYESRTA